MDQTMTKQLSQLHKDWIKFLRENPELQEKQRLGTVNPETNEIISACCLGVLQHKVYPDYVKFTQGEYCIVDKNKLCDLNLSVHMTSFPSYSYKKLGIYTNQGHFNKFVYITSDRKFFFCLSEVEEYCEANKKEFLCFGSLAQINDNVNASWELIADIIEANPENVIDMDGDYSWYEQQ